MRKAKREDIVARWAEILAMTLERAGLTGRAASEVAIESMSELRREFGGAAVYVSRGRIDGDERGAQAYAFWEKGLQVKDIAFELDCTTRWAYKLLEREKSRLSSIRKRQELLISGTAITKHRT